MKLAIPTLAVYGLLCVPPVAAQAEEIAPAKALADYVARPDASQKWKLRREGSLGNTKYVELTLTSQTWRNIVWKHQLFILKPSTAPANAEHALLFIGGSSWKESLAEPTAPNEKMPGEARTLALIAEQLKTPVAILLQVPQQPIFDGKVEDAIIALTFENYVRTGEADWPLLLPMVKSAVAGMNATQAFASQEWKLDLKTFTVSGASKRGWTTWLTGAVDKRAVAIAPMVIDMLNMATQMKHQKDTWGDLSEEIIDYKERGLDRVLETPRGKLLASIVDPYAYREQLTQPKFIILGTNDRYWPLDSLNHYWDGLEGDKHVMYVPNNGHGLTDLPRIAGAVHALQQQVIRGEKLPTLTWKHEVQEQQWSLSLTSSTETAAIRVWQAQSETKDFRDSKWQSTELTAGKSVAFDRPLPKTGYAAMFLEAEYKNLDLPYFLSTQLKIVEAKE
ncbi:MAG TPA: PhoPQ-activated protein PqaA family protein [Pirellulaceae bacterium]|nr:PhoPQ-activated protein PqaA family protein [Pirellulaceae bacterium]